MGEKPFSLSVMSWRSGVPIEGLRPRTDRRTQPNGRGKPAFHRLEGRSTPHDPENVTSRSTEAKGQGVSPETEQITSPSSIDETGFLGDIFERGKELLS
jgi:hypothetical protein